MSNYYPSTDLTDSFINGLMSYNINYDEITSGKWKYCGGNVGTHLNYFQICHQNRVLPPFTDYCVCGHKIFINCYITNNETILVLGNCCIKKFIQQSSRTCEKCGQPHKNRIVNRCHHCRSGVCDSCHKVCHPKYKKCFNCCKKISHIF